MNIKILEGQELVDCFDKGLRLLEDFGRKTFRRVYRVERYGRVERDGEPCVFKAYCPPIPTRVSHLNVFLMEARILERLSDVERVAHLLMDYGRKGEYAAFLREFTPGMHLDDALKQGASEAWAIGQVTETLEQIHKRGVAGLGLNCEDIIVSPDFSRATIIDTGFGSLSEDYYDQRDFESLKKEDFERLDQSIKYRL